MSNTLYGLGFQKILKAEINVETADIRAVLVGPGYVPNFETHEFLSSLGANTLGAAVALAGKTAALGVFDANDVTIAAIASGSTASAIVLYVHTGVAGTSPLLMYIDDAVGLPLLTNGADMPIKWSNGPSKIFSR